jgi:hypothetical protein
VMKKPRKENPSIGHLIECFNYDPMTGRLSWRERPVTHFKDEHSWRVTNCKYAGKEIAGADEKGYLRVPIHGKNYRVHRVCFAIYHGRWPDKQVDHIDGDKANNKIGNLREATNSQNQMNRGAAVNNTSGYKGVHFNKAAKKWHAQIRKKGKNIYLGVFDDPHDAYLAYCQAADKIHGQFANSGKVGVNL